MFTERPPGLFLAAGGYLALPGQFGYHLQSRMGTGPPHHPSPQTQQLPWELSAGGGRPSPLRSRPAPGLILPLPLAGGVFLFVVALQLGGMEAAFAQRAGQSAVAKGRVRDGCRVLSLPFREVYFPWAGCQQRPPAESFTSPPHKTPPPHPSHPCHPSCTVCTHLALLPCECVHVTVDMCDGSCKSPVKKPDQVNVR